MSEPKAPYSLKDLILYMLKLGAIGFGGPVALVEQKNWNEENFGRLAIEVGF